MAITFPTTLDTLTNPVATDDTVTVPHATQHANANDAIEALEAKVGVNGSAVTTSHDYKLSAITGSDKAVGASATQTLTNKTITSPAGLVKADVGLGNVDNTSDATKNSAVATLTNKTLTTPTITKPVMSATNPTAQAYTPSAAGTATLDLSLSNVHFITMPAGNITIALTNDTNNQTFLVRILQDGVGSRTVTWFSTIRWVGGVVPTLTTTASKADVFGFIRTGSGTYDGFIVGQNL